MDRVPLKRDTVYGRGAAWSVLAMMVLITVTMDLVRQPIYFLIDPLQKTFHVNDVQISLLLGAAMAIPVAIMSLVGGGLSDRMSRRVLITLAMLAWTAGALLFGLSSRYEALVVGRVLVGLGTGILIPVAMTWINDAFPENSRGRANGLFFIALSLGPAEGGFVTGFLNKFIEHGGFAAVPWLGSLDGWRVLVVVLAVPTVLLVPFVWTLADRRGATVAAGDGASGAVANAGRADWYLPTLMIAGIALIVMVDTANITWMPTVLKRKFGMDTQQIGVTFGIIATTAGIVGPLVGGWIGDAANARYGTGGRLWISAALAAICAVLLFAYFSDNELFVLTALGLNGVLTIAVLVMGYVGLQAVLPPGRRGLGTGAMGAANSLVGAVGPTLVAFFSDRLGNGPSALIIATAVVCPALSALAAMAIAMTARAYMKTVLPSTTQPQFANS